MVSYRVAVGTPVNTWQSPKEAPGRFQLCKGCMPIASTEFGTSKNNLRQMPGVKGELEIIIYRACSFFEEMGYKHEDRPGSWHGRLLLARLRRL